MKQEKKLHIVSFDVPYPPDYGGVIDVFYKLKALSEEGIKIYLHCFQYGRGKAPELEAFCEKVFYYKRKTGLAYAFNKKPYIVAGRNHAGLLQNILKNEAPILFEGLHSCFFIDRPELKGYRKIVRAHNIEHDYYSHLADSGASLLKQIYFKREAKKLKKYEPIIKHADSIISISPSDQEYFQKTHPNATFIPAFHEFDTVCSMPGKGAYFLFHGNLSVPENIKSIHFLLDEVFNGLHIKLIIAGKNPSQQLLSKISKSENTEVFINPSHQKMEDLIKNAQACVIPSFQATGLKLKLLASLFNGRFCLTNSFMVENTGLEKLCIVADSAGEMKNHLNRIKDEEFTKQMIQQRQQLFNNSFSNKKGISLLIKQIFTQK